MGAVTSFAVDRLLEGSCATGVLGLDELDGSHQIFALLLPCSQITLRGFGSAHVLVSFHKLRQLSVGGCATGHLLAGGAFAFVELLHDVFDHALSAAKCGAGDEQCGYEQDWFHRFVDSFVVVVVVA